MVIQFTEVGKNKRYPGFQRRIQVPTLLTLKVNCIGDLKLTVECR